MNYIPKILTYENYYVYRVTAPERCTLSIKRIHGYWKLDEIKTYSNQSVSYNTLREISPWLLQHELISEFVWSEMIKNYASQYHRQVNEVQMFEGTMLSHEDAPF